MRGRLRPGVDRGEGRGGGEVRVGWRDAGRAVLRARRAPRGRDVVPFDVERLLVEVGTKIVAAARAERAGVGRLPPRPVPASAAGAAANSDPPQPPSPARKSAAKGEDVKRREMVANPKRISPSIVDPLSVTGGARAGRAPREGSLSGEGLAVCWPARACSHAVEPSAPAWKACPMNVSSACPQCGAIANSNDKFCNTCGTPLQRPGASAPQGPPQGQPPYAQPQAAPPPPQYAQPQYAQPGYPPAAPQPPQYGAPAGRPAPRCQLGHEIMPGMSYCAQGHPIALDAMQFASDPNSPYAQPPQGPPPAPPPGPGDGGPAYGAGPPAPPPPPQDDPARPPAPAQGLGFGGPPQFQPSPPQAYGGAPAFPAPQPVFQPAAVPPPPAPGQYAPPPALHPGYPAEVPVGLAAGAKQLRGFVVTFQSNPAGEFWPLSTGRTTVGRANAPEPAGCPAHRRHHLVPSRRVQHRRRLRLGRGHELDERHVRERGAHRPERPARAPRRRSRPASADTQPWS